jgi:8-oxo-dGTP pyrophosphatase MutT (NUDIX family)
MRPGRDPFEVLMVERGGRGMFASLVVFPGGSVDDEDRRVADARGLGRGGEHRLAALRELAEETGLAALAGGVTGVPDDLPTGLYGWLDEGGHVLDTGSLVMVSRWVTPEHAPYRYDTRFFLVGLDETPPIRLDTVELVGHAWVTPAEALAKAASGVWDVILPTLAHLRWLSRRSSIGDALDSARGADGRTLVTPRLVEDGSLVPVHLPGD